MAKTTMSLRVYNNIEKVSTKQELLYLLKKYQGILSTSMVDYLNSLIELEFSIIRDYISEENRTVLAELDIYRKIAIYNIYNRALNIFSGQSEQFHIMGNNDGNEGLIISADSVSLFEFMYKNNITPNSNIPQGYRTNEIGTISLYQTIENEKLRKEELERVMSILDSLYSEVNPFSFFPNPPGTVGGPASKWTFEHEAKINEYWKKFAELDEKKELTDEEKRKIEITKKYYDLLLQDYGLTSEDFEIKKADSIFDIKKESTVLSQTLVKRMPNLSIVDHIKYI